MVKIFCVISFDSEGSSCFFFSEAVPEGEPPEQKTHFLSFMLTELRETKHFFAIRDVFNPVEPREDSGFFFFLGGLCPFPQECQIKKQGVNPKLVSESKAKNRCRKNRSKFAASERPSFRIVRTVPKLGNCSEFESK